MSTKEILVKLKSFSASDKLLIAEALLKEVRELNYPLSDSSDPEIEVESLFGIWTPEEAKEFEDALKDTRRIDSNEW